MTQKPDGGRAFPAGTHKVYDEDGVMLGLGMSLRDYFAGQALANPAICTGEATNWQVQAWGFNVASATRPQIVAAQANEYADAMIAARGAG